MFQGSLLCSRFMWHTLCFSFLLPLFFPGAALRTVPPSGSLSSLLETSVPWSRCAPRSLSTPTWKRREGGKDDVAELGIKSQEILRFTCPIERWFEATFKSLQRLYWVNFTNITARKVSGVFISLHVCKMLKQKNKQKKFLQAPELQATFTDWLCSCVRGSPRFAGAMVRALTLGCLARTGLLTKITNGVKRHHRIQTRFSLRRSGLSRASFGEPVRSYVCVKDRGGEKQTAYGARPTPPTHAHTPHTHTHTPPAPATGILRSVKWL